nr:putative late blight resistance protein homolog R1B-17 [Ipomoea batatas]
MEGINLAAEEETYGDSIAVKVLFSHRPSIVASVRDIQAKLKKNFGKENFEIKIQGQGPEECVEDVEKANSEIKMEDGDESLAGGRW